MDQWANLALAAALALGERHSPLRRAFPGWHGRPFPDLRLDATQGVRDPVAPDRARRDRFLVFVEFFADKIPGLDSLWGAIHTFIRIPAGALLAAGVIGQADGEAWMMAAALLGGTITAGTHLFKEGSRAAINTSPEPVTNIAASVTEEAAVVGGLWLAFQHPIVFLLLLALFLLLAIWLVPKIIRYIVGLVRRILGWLSPAGATTT